MWQLSNVLCYRLVVVDIPSACHGPLNVTCDCHCQLLVLAQPADTKSFSSTASAFIAKFAADWRTINVIQLHTHTHTHTNRYSQPIKLPSSSVSFLPVTSCFWVTFIHSQTTPGLVRWRSIRQQVDFKTVDVPSASCCQYSAVQTNHSMRRVKTGKYEHYGRYRWVKRGRHIRVV